MGFSSFVFSWCASVALAGGTLQINEIYYDHPGSDDGYEFVELINTTTVPVALAGVRLEFHNGSGEGWTLLWSGAAADTIAAGGWFVVGAARVAPSPDAVVSLSLQNGPDAVRLTQAGDVLDAVGYGGLDDPAFSETRSAPPAAAGQSLSRVPDGADTDDNGADFVAQAPSPGGRNLPRYNATLGAATGTALARANAFAGAERIVVSVRNSGTAEMPAGAAVVALSDSSREGDGVVAESPVVRALAAGETTDIGFDVLLPSGYHRLIARVTFAEDERPGDNAVMLLRRVGVVPLLVSEVLADAPPACPQFVEFYNAGNRELSMAAFRLRDRAHAPATITAAALVVQARDYVVVTPDREALLRCFPAAAPERVIPFAGSWPTFNRTGGVVADSVVVTDAWGLPVDAVAYPSLPSGITGVSVERVNLFAGGGVAVWVTSDDISGATPGREGSRRVLSPPAPGTVTAAPNPFAPSRGEVLAISISPGVRTAKVRASVYDTRGRRRADIGVASAFPAVLLWNGADSAGAPLPAGLYVLAVESFAADGVRVHVARVVVARAPD